MTLTNGEGSGHCIPGTGIQLNNFLGEEDLNPGGFHEFDAGAPLPSMIAPTIVRSDAGVLALGSGGANRIRSVVSQVLYRVAFQSVPLEDAVMAPRVHAEEREVWVELADRDHPERIVAKLEEAFGSVYTFPFRAFFFGGVHAVFARGDQVTGIGDPRRGGAVARG